MARASREPCGCGMATASGCGSPRMDPTGTCGMVEAGSAAAAPPPPIEARLAPSPCAQSLVVLSSAAAAAGFGPRGSLAAVEVAVPVLVVVRGAPRALRYLLP